MSITIGGPGTGGSIDAATGAVWAAKYGVSAASADNSAALQAAISAARANAAAHGYRLGTVILPSGTINLTSAAGAFILGPTVDGPPVALVGQGRFDTLLSWGQANDLGEGAWAFDATGTSFRFVMLRALSLLGPGISNSLGRPPGRSGGGYIAMNGVKIQSAEMHEVEVARWNIGIGLYESHNKLVDVVSGSNYIGAYIDTFSGAIANNGYTRCDFTGNNLASIACSKRNGILADSLIDIHLGFSPFGIYQRNTDPSIVEPLFIASSNFSEVAFESCGHAAIYCEDNTGNVTGNFFEEVTASGVPDTNFRIPNISITGCATTNGSATVACSSTNGLAAGMPLSGTNVPVGACILAITNSTHFTMTAPATGTGSGLTFTVSYRTDYAISVGAFGANEMRGTPDLLLACEGTAGVIDAPLSYQQNIMCAGLTDCWRGGLRFLSARTSIVESGGPSNQHYNGYGSGVIEIAGAAITKGQLLQYGGSGGFWRVKPYDHTTAAKCIGIAANDAAQGDQVGVIKTGVATGLPATGYSNNGNGDPLKPSTTEDGKFTNGTFGTDQIVGFLRNGNTMVLNV